MTHYWDSSALLKRYVPEEGSEKVARLLRRGINATSRLTFVELAAAASRRFRQLHISRADLARVLADVEADETEFHVVDLLPDIAAEARELVRTHPLRAADAVQLASCLDLRRRFGGGVTLVAWDRDLLDVARALGLPTAGGPA